MVSNMTIKGDSNNYSLGALAMCRQTTATVIGFFIRNSQKARWGLCAIMTMMVLLQGCTTSGALSGSSAGVPTRHAMTAEALMDLVQEAELAYQSAQWDTAAAQYQKLVGVLPDDPYAWFRLGNSLTQQGRYSQAILAYERSLEYDSVQAKPWFNLSTTYLLGAQVATLKAWEAEGISDDTRAVAQNRLNMLTALLQ